MSSKEPLPNKFLIFVKQISGHNDEANDDAVFEIRFYLPSDKRVSKCVANLHISFEILISLHLSYKLENESRKFAIDYGDELIVAARQRNIMEENMMDENGNPLVKKDMKINYIIDQLVNHEEKFSDQEIREHILVLLITASETSANYVATSLIYLAIYQDIQQKVYDEICEVFHDDTVEINYETVGQLKYLEMVMKGKSQLPGQP